MLKKFNFTLVKFTSAFFPAYMAQMAVNRFSSPRRFERTELELACFERGRQYEFASGRIANICGETEQADQPLIILVHGWESRGTTFYMMIETLVAQGYKVLAWNAPAHGASPGKKTQIYDMAKALAEDLIASKLSPKAIVGHSMGGALMGVLHKYLNLPPIVVIISAPSKFKRVFWPKFKSYGMSDKAVKICFEQIEAMGGHSLDNISLYNSTLFKGRSVLVVHDENDREIPFSEFTSLQPFWPTATFHPTQGLGHRRILRDAALADTITLYIQQNL